MAGFQYRKIHKTKTVRMDQTTIPLTGLISFLSDTKVREKQVQKYCVLSHQRKKDTSLEVKSARTQCSQRRFLIILSSYTPSEYVYIYNIQLMKYVHIYIYVCVCVRILLQYNL